MAAPSPIRLFLEGEDVQPNENLDLLVWLNTSGYKKLIVHGKPPEAYINRTMPQVSIEKFLSKYLQYFFREDISRAKVEELYIRFTNQLTHEEAQIVYDATEGKIPMDLDRVEAYVGDRRFANGALIFQRPEPKNEGDGKSDGDDEGASKTPPEGEQKPASEPEKKPEENQPVADKKPARGRKPKAPPAPPATEA